MRYIVACFACLFIRFFVVVLMGYLCVFFCFIVIAFMCVLTGILSEIRLNAILAISGLLVSYYKHCGF